MMTTEMRKTPEELIKELGEAVQHLREEVLTAQGDAEDALWAQAEMQMETGNAAELHQVLRDMTNMLETFCGENEALRTVFGDVLRRSEVAMRGERRNCHRFSNGDEAWEAWMKEATSNDDKHRNEDYERWLWKEAEEEKN